MLLLSICFLRKDAEKSYKTAHAVATFFRKVKEIAKRILQRPKSQKTGVFFVFYAYYLKTFIEVKKYINLFLEARIILYHACPVCNVNGNV